MELCAPVVHDVSRWAGAGRLLVCSDAVDVHATGRWTSSRRRRSVALLFVLSALTFVPAARAQQDTQPPFVSNLSPAADATGVSVAIEVTATFNERVQPQTIAFVLRDASNAAVPGTVTYDQLKRTATLHPTAQLVAGGTYTAAISGARDLAGNLLSPISWTFTAATPDFQDPVVLGGLLNPTAIQFASDGRVFVAEKSGLIRVFDSLTDSTPTLFADLRTNVYDFGERGLLGMALDPAFPTRPYVYVLYTYDALIGGTAPRWGSPNGSQDPCPDPVSAGCTVSARVSRLQASGNQMVGAEQILVEDWFQQFPGQSVGGLAFGPDGALYASAGDGAASTFVDMGQTANPSPDPPNEGGALRSQDLRTPADRVTLDGAIIRIDPNTGLPLPRTVAMSVEGPTIDGNGVRSYSVTSAFQGTSPTIVRVLQPTAPAPGKPHRILYVLPVEAGLTDTSSQYSDGLEELRLLNVPNRFNVTLIAPSFHIEPWYGDHSTESDRRLESFIVNDLVPFGDAFASSATTERWLIGFSKSATGALSLIFRHPHVFSAAAAWDGPAQFTDLSAFPGMAENFGTEENFDLYEIPTLVARNAEAFWQQRRIWISGDQSAWTSQMEELHDQMLQAGVLHTFAQGGLRAHSWFSGWLDGAITALDANATPIAPIDLNAQRVVAYGLRNPARFTFRPGTSEIWLGDAGSNAVEEINWVVNATDGIVENFGWPCYEGTSATSYSASGICDQLPASATVAPSKAYLHAQPLFAGDACATGGSAISGLAFARSTTYPSAFNDSLFVSDRLRGCIWAVLPAANGVPNFSTATSVIAAAATPVDLQSGPGGDIFYADLDGGNLRRVQYSSGNLPPVAQIAAGPSTFGPDPLTVDFTAAASTDPEGAVLSYAWDLDGDGAFDDATSSQANFTYVGSGSRTVQVRVSDGQGLSAVAAVLVTPNNTPPVPAIQAPGATTSWRVGQAISFSGSATDAEDGALPAAALSWSLIVHHCPSTCHNHVVQDFTGTAGGSFTAPNHEYPAHLELRLTAIDAMGVQSSTSVLLQPATVALSFASSPAGLELTVNSVTSTTPFVRTVIEGSTNTISAPSPQGTRQFVSWSDGGAQTHAITGTAPATYTATFTTPPPPNLVLGLGFDEGAGTTAADRSPNANNGTISGATWITQGRFGKALSFDGVDDWVTVADSNSLDLTTGLTIEAWVFPIANGGGSWRNVLIKERSGGEVYNLYANADTNAPTMFVVRSSQPSSPLDARGTAQIAVNAWTHLAATYDGATVRLYVNGTEVGSRSGSGTVLTSTGALRIGGNSLWGEYFSGRIDEIRVYNRALSAVEIQTDMTTPVSDTTPPGISNPQPTGTLPAGTAQATLAVTTDENAICRYGTVPGVAYAALPGAFTTTGGTAHSTTVTGLAGGASYTYYVRCQDAASNANGTDAIISFAVAVDTILPVVAITSPADGATVAGVITVSATASDDGGIAGVQFLLDGASLGPEDTDPPYSVSWDTTGVPAASHLLSARARDAAGNLTTSSGIGVAVANNPVPANFLDEVVIGSGLMLPTALEFLPDGRMLVAELTGRLKIVQPGAAIVDATPVLQLTNFFAEDISGGGERGLVNVIADPTFATNGYIYLFYTAATPQRDRVSRFTMVGNTASLASELVVWQGVADSTSTDHHGGGLAFGPDGKLYISTGDNGAPSSAPSLNGDHGKILRVNPDGTIPADNPFNDGAGANIDAIWARGLRNPFRFSFDSIGGRLYIGDVGEHLVEEVNIGVAGANYGWPTCEGSCGTPALTNPLFSYSHGGRDASVTGGFVYRGTQFPAAYRGAYFYGDFAQNWIRYLTLDGSGNVTGGGNLLPADGSADGPYDPVMLKPGPDGSLYYVDFGWESTVNPASIRRIRYVQGNQPPIAVAAATPRTGTAPLSVAFSSAGSMDPESQALTYSWVFGDGASSTQANPTHVYAQTGVFNAQLTVSDGTTAAVSEILVISVGTLPTATITSPVNGSTFRAGDVISFAGVGTDLEDGALPPSALSWTILFHHDTHVHPGQGPTPGAAGSFTIPSSGHDFAGNTSYEILLTATDSHGLQKTASVFVFPAKVSVTFATNPPGLAITLDGISRVAPYVHDTLIGFRHTVNAPNQTSGSLSYSFMSWSDGGAQTHEIVAPSSAQTFTAAFQSSGPPPPAGLVAGYGFNEGSGTTSQDVSGNNLSATVSGAAWTTQGKYGSALSFDGVNDWVTVADANALDLTTGMTLEAWVYPTASGSGSWRNVLIKERTGGEAYNLYANTDTNVPAVYVVRAAQVNVPLDARGTGALPLNTWTHLAATYDGTTLRMFVNGAQAGSRAVSGAMVTSTGALRVGGNSLWGEYFAGRIDEVRIYNRALTAAEVQADMNTPVGGAPSDTAPPTRSNAQPTGTLPAGTTQTTLGLTTNEPATCRYSTVAGVAYSAMTGTFTTTGGTVHATTVAGLANGQSYSYYVRCQDGSNNANPDDFAVAFSVATPPSDTTPPVVAMTAPAAGATVTGNVTVSADASDNIGVVGVQFLLNGAALGAEDTSAPYSIAWNSNTVSNGSYQVSARVRDAAGNLATSPARTVTVNNTTGVGLVASYSFNEGSGTTLIDRTGNGRTGTVSGATWTTQGKYGSALSFDGVNDWVTVADANALDLTTGMTLEAWVYPTASGSGSWRNVLIKERTGGEAYNLYANTDTNVPAVYVVRAAQMNVPLDARGTGALPLNTWTHLAATYDGTTLRMFVNGAQAGSRAVSGAMVTSTGALRIGGNSLWGEYFAGRIDEVRIYNRALTPAEIAADSAAPVVP
jgi:glucose/arabinose dehydrogenase/PKD repeat protein